MYDVCVSFSRGTTQKGDTFCWPYIWWRTRSAKRKHLVFCFGCLKVFGIYNTHITHSERRLFAQSDVCDMKYYAHMGPKCEWKLVLEWDKKYMRACFWDGWPNDVAAGDHQLGALLTDDDDDYTTDDNARGYANICLYATAHKLIIGYGFAAPLWMAARRREEIYEKRKIAHIHTII